MLDPILIARDGSDTGTESNDSSKRSTPLNSPGILSTMPTIPAGQTQDLMARLEKATPLLHKF